MKLIAVLLLGCLLAMPAGAMTFDEFKEFTTWLSTDSTDRAEYVNGTHDCGAFAYGLMENATGAGYRVHMANLQGEPYPGGHWINAVLVDGEYRFIEPQADIEVFPEDLQIMIIDDGKAVPEYIIGKNEITITGDVLIRAY